MSENPSQQGFDSLVKHYYDAWFRYHPEAAVDIGVPGYEEELSPYDDEEIGALISLNQKIISSLDELNFFELSAQQQLDFKIIYHAASIELHELLEQDWRYKKPQQYLPLQAINQLLGRPVENLHQALKHRLQAVPQYLRGARRLLAEKPELIPLQWADDAIESARAGVEFFRDLLHHPQLTSQFKNPARLQPVCDEAVHALEDYEKFLLSEIRPKAKGSFSCGEKHFNKLLNDWHGLGIDAQQLYRFGEKLFKQTRQSLLELCEQLPGSNDLQEQLAAIREKHPPNQEELMNAYRARMKAAYNFVAQHGLVSLPEQQALKVVETPVFMRHQVPFAAYDEPTYNDPQQRGFYYVTPVKSEGHLLEHNWISIDLTCVHEAFPGHHLQFVTANNNPQNSWARMLNASPTLYEGWALYCEDMMQEQGFLDKPEHQFVMLRDRLWRAMRVMLDVELHTQELSIDAAAQRMCDELGFAIDQAKADLSWYSYSPTVPMGYALGWALIKALRDIESEKQGFELKSFHDRLLCVGSCALPLVIQQEFGEETWNQVKARVFESS